MLSLDQCDLSLSGRVIAISVQTRLNAGFHRFLFHYWRAARRTHSDPFDTADLGKGGEERSEGLHEGIYSTQRLLGPGCERSGPYIRKGISAEALASSGTATCAVSIDLS